MLCYLAWNCRVRYYVVQYSQVQSRAPCLACAALGLLLRYERREIIHLSFVVRVCAGLQVVLGGHTHGRSQSEQQKHANTRHTEVLE